MKSPSTKSSDSRTFRLASLDDAEHIVGLLLALNGKIGAIYGIPADTRSIVEAVNFTIQNGVCLVGPCACAGGFITPYVWNRNAKIGQILFWNYSQPSGVRIFRAIADEFRRLGATHINCSSHFPENKARRHYTRYGLHPIEIQHSCALADMTKPFSKTSA